MTTVGIVGGLGPESTIDYYRRILDAWERIEPGTSPSIVIDSLDVGRALRLVAGDLTVLTEYLLASVRRLAGAGAGFVAMTANTPHIVFDELAARSPVPLLSIVEVCADEAKRRGLRRLLLLGTRFTMEAPFYPAVCARHGIEVVTPDAAGRAWVHERYVGQLLKGEFRDDTRAGVVALVRRLRDEARVDGVILGGTELPLLLQAPVVAELPALDTTALHVAAIVGRLREPSAPATLAALQTIPVLRVFDVDKAREFYLGFLGFQVDWEHRFDPDAPLYMQVSRGGCVLHLTEHHGDASPGGTAHVRVTGLEAYHREIAAKGYRYQRPGIDVAPWNAKLVQVTDPFGNRLRFSEDLPKRAGE